MYFYKVCGTASPLHAAFMGPFFFLGPTSVPEKKVISFAFFMAPRVLRLVLTAVPKNNDCYILDLYYLVRTMHVFWDHIVIVLSS